MKELEALQAEKGSKLWKLLQPKLARGKENAEKDALRCVVDEKDGKAKIAAGQAIAYSHMLAEVDNSGANIEMFMERIQTLRDQLKTAKEHGGIIG